MGVEYRVILVTRNGFHRSTLLTDANQLRKSDFDGPSGLLGLFYTRESNKTTVEALPERYTAEDIAEKIVRDIEYRYDADARVCEIADFDGLRHRVHKQGAVITWLVE